MAEYHVRAVQKYSRINEFDIRHMLEIIALDIGRDDSPAYTSLRKLSERARCAINTARKRIAVAVLSGELIQRREGKYTVYSLNPELIPYGSTQAETSQENEGSKGFEAPRFATKDDLIQLEQRLYQLYQQQAELYQSSYQKIVSIVSTHQADYETKGIEKDIEKEGKRGRTRTRKPNHFDDFNSANKNRPMVQIEMEQAIKEIVTDKRKLQEIEDSAIIALGLDASPEDINRLFGEDAIYWYQVGHGKKDMLPPYAKNIGTDLGRALRWEQNGSTVPAQPKQHMPAQSQFIGSFQAPN